MYFDYSANLHVNFRFVDKDEFIALKRILQSIRVKLLLVLTKFECWSYSVGPFWEISSEDKRGSRSREVLSSAEAVPWVLCLVLGLSLQGHWCPEACPKSNKVEKGLEQKSCGEQLRNWDCLVWRSRGSGEASLLSTTTWRKVVANWGSASSPM